MTMDQARVYICSNTVDVHRISLVCRVDKFAFEHRMIKDVNRFGSSVFLRYIRSSDNNWSDQRNVRLRSSPYIYFYLKDLFVSHHRPDRRRMTHIERSVHDHRSVSQDCTSVERDSRRPDLSHGNNRDRPNNRRDRERATTDSADIPHLVCNFALMAERKVHR